MKKAFPLFVLFIAAVFVLSPAAPAESLTADDVQRYIEAGRALNLSGENFQLSDEEAMKDAYFMGLLRGKLRVARILRTAEFSENTEDKDALRTQAGPVIAYLCQDGFPTPDKLVENAVERIVKPLELQGVLKELSRYYEAIVSTAEWQKKFQKILSRGEYPSLDNGTIFHLLDFPELGGKPYYMAALDIELKDETLFLYEGDSSVEGWLYSFWLRRWQDGTMDATKLALDWMNKALGQ